MFTQCGAASAPLTAREIRSSQESSPSVVRALTAGKAPIAPAVQAATTRSGPEMRSIGATSSGTRSRAASDAGSRSEIVFSLIRSVTFGASR